MNPTIILTFSIILTSCVISQAFACECKSLKEREQYLLDSDSIFLGKVKSIEKTSDGYPSYIIGFDVDKIWKGTDTKEISIKSSMNSGTCAYTFEINQILVVHAQQESGALEEKSCGTLPAEYAIDHIKILDENVQNNPIKKLSSSNVQMIFAYLDNPFEIKFNQTAIIASDDIRVKFSKVTSDSRCPSDVTCIWQGEIHIQVDAQKENTNFEGIGLAFGGEGNAEIPIFDKYFIRLLKVDPYPQSTDQIQLDDYVATLMIVKTTQDQVLSPLQQFKSGVPADEIQCNDGLQLVIKASIGNPACVKQETMQKLIELGWGAKLETMPDSKTPTAHLDKNYTLQVNDNIFEIRYSIIGSLLQEIIADINAKSLIVNVEGLDNGHMVIEIPRKLIDARNGPDSKSGFDVDFFVLVDGSEVDFEETSSIVARILTIPLKNGSSQIEIIGTIGHP